MWDARFFEWLSDPTVPELPVEGYDGLLCVEESCLTAGDRQGRFHRPHQRPPEAAPTVGAADRDAFYLPGRRVDTSAPGGTGRPVSNATESVDCRRVLAVVLKFGSDPLFVDEHRLADVEGSFEVGSGADQVDPIVCHTTASLAIN